MADAFAANDVVRLDLNGTDNSTTITDSAGSPHTFVCNGTAKLRTTSMKYGTASAAFDGTSTCTITSVNSSDWDMGSGDFCVDFFFKTTSPKPQTLFSISDGTTTAISMGIQGGDTLTGYAKVKAAYFADAPAQQVVVHRNLYHHAALTRSGNTLYLYLDGMLADTEAVTGALDWNTNMVLVLGGSAAAAGSFIGNIDQFRLTKGASRYSITGFIPPVNGTFDSFEATPVTSTTLGPRTTQVSVYGASNYDSIIAKFNESVQALGWTLYDTYYKGTVTLVYRCLNADGVTYKYVAFIWDKSRAKVIQIGMESWNSHLKIPINECWNSLRGDGTHGFAIINCDIVIFGSTRYLGMVTYLQGSYSVWSMCVETEREAPEDTVEAAFPCWGMIYGNEFLGTSAHTRYSLFRQPRSRTNETGNMLNQYKDWYQSLMTSFGIFGEAYGRGNNFSTSLFAAWNTHKNAISGWDNLKRLVSNVKIFKTDARNSYDVAIHTTGRLFGVKVGPAFGNMMDKLPIPIDSDMFASGTGADTDHWVLHPVNPTSNGYWLQGSTGVSPASQVWMISQVINCMAYTGQHVYIGTNTLGLYKVDLVGGGGNNAIVGTTGQILDICFDGRYMFASYPSGVYRVDTQNSDAVTTLVVGTGGTRGLCHNGRGQLFASDRNASTSPKVYKIETASMTLIGTATAVGALVSGSILPSLACDDQLRTVCAPTGNASTATDASVLSVDQNTMATSFNTTGNAAWNTITGMTADNFGICWTGQYFHVSHLLMGAGGQCMDYCHDWAGRNVAPYGMMAVTAMTNQGQGPVNKICIERYAGHHLIVSCNTTAATWNAWHGNAYPDQAGSNVHGTSTQLQGTSLSGTNLASRCAVVTGNTLLFGGNDGFLYQAKDIHQKGYYSTSVMPQLFIPR